MFFHQSSVTANEWRAAFYQDHVLVGKIWDTHKQDWISNNQFYRELLHYDYILLGEVHDHPDHHILQAKVIDYLANSGIKPTVVMEMLNLESWKDQPSTWKKVTELKELAKMLNDGWPWDLYLPILNSVVKHQLDLSAGNISSEELQRWSNQHQPYNLGSTLKKHSFTKNEYTLLKKNIIESHCGHANEDFVNYLSQAQIKRDHFMASILSQLHTPVVFIVGRGHVRNDYAVPMQLRRNFNQNAYFSVVYIPVQEGMEDAQAYLQGNHHLYDVLVFTPNHDLEDPCEKFTEQLQNMHNKESL